MCGSIVDIQSPTAEIRRGKKEGRRKDRNHRAKIYWPALLHRAAINSDIQLGLEILLLESNKTSLNMILILMYIYSVHIVHGAVYCTVLYLFNIVDYLLEYLLCFICF